MNLLRQGFLRFVSPVVQSAPMAPFRKILVPPSQAAQVRPARADPPAEALPVGLWWGKQAGLSEDPSVTYPLVAHLLDAAAAAEMLVERFCTSGQREVLAGGDAERAVSPAMLAAVLAGWHDLGKAMPGWQRPHAPWLAERVPVSKESDQRRPSPRHEQAAYWQLRKIFEEQQGKDVRENEGAVGNMLAQIVGGHHGLFQGHEGIDQRSGLTLDATLAMDESLEAHVVWSAARTNLAATISTVLGAPACLPDALPSSMGPVQGSLLTGVVILADWLMSQVSVISPVLGALPTTPEGWTLDRLTAHHQQAKGRALRAARSVGLVAEPFQAKSFSVQFPQFTPYGPQIAAIEDLPALIDGPGLWLVMAPTGDGKTEAGLHAASLMAQASGASGVLLALPTMATTDAMYRRVQKFLLTAGNGNDRLSLLHSSARLHEEYVSSALQRAKVAADQRPEELSSAELAGEAEPQVSGDGAGCQSLAEVTDWAVGSRKALLAPHSVATIDQILAMALRAKWQPLRLLGITCKVVVIDEAHSYDQYMQVLLQRALTWLAACQVPVVVMSATLSQQMAKAFISAYRAGAGFSDDALLGPVSYPGWLYADGRTGQVTAGVVPPTGRERTVQFDLEDYPDGKDWDAAPLAGAVLAHLAPLLRTIDPAEGNVLVVCNTVAESVAVHTALRDAAGADCPVWLMHSRFPKNARISQAEQAEAWYGKDSRSGPTPSRPIRSILVATQVVEQSLDLDMDLVISDLAPAAQLIQRLGRGHRHASFHDADGRAQVVIRPRAFAIPRLVVLVPRRPDGSLAARDARPYDQVLLDRSLRVLTELLQRTQGRFRVPEDIQLVMDVVYDADFTAELMEQDLSRFAVRAFVQDDQKRQSAHFNAIPVPAGVHSLAELTSVHDPDALLGRVSARYELSTVTIVPVWSLEGVLYLDPGGEHLLPVGQRTGGWLTMGQRNAIALRSISVPWGAWSESLQERDAQIRPASWAAQRSLDDVRLLKFAISRQLQNACKIGQPALDCREHHSDLDSHTARLSTSQGLVLTRKAKA